MTGPTLPLTYLFEVSSLDPTASVDRLATTLLAVGDSVRIVGGVAAYPALIVEVGSHDRERLLVAANTTAPRLEVTELRRYVDADHLTPTALIALIIEGAAAGRLAVGAGAVERTAQRRRLELLVASADMTSDYRKMIEAFVKSAGYLGPRIVTPLSVTELGRAAGVKRTACVGLLRGAR